MHSAVRQRPHQEDRVENEGRAVKQTIIAIIMIAAFVAASLIALSMIGEIAVNSNSTQSDIQTR
jgi:hypothetical protein